MSRAIELDMNWKLLRRQKLDLLNVLEKNRTLPGSISSTEADSLTGILHLLDSVQDEALDAGRATAKEIFGS